jgi:solute carrier family 25 aspartate/glutamate transporter 12/13
MLQKTYLPAAQEADDSAKMQLRSHKTTRPLSPVVVSRTHKPQSVFQSMWIGATAGMGGIIAVYPVDVVKTRMQNSRVSSSAVQILNNIIKHEGIVSFYKGLGPQLCGTIPDKAISLATREYVKGKFADPNAFTASFASAVCSGISQSVVMNPVEIVKVRMQIDSSLNAVGVIRELGVRGIYRGYSACVARDVMFAATYFTLYDYAKRKLQIEDGSSLGWAMAAASTAGIPAAFFSTPLDVLKTRMQSRGAPQQGFVNTFKQVYSEGGMNALFAGWGPRVGRIAPQFGIVLVSYDWLQHRFSAPRN